MAERIKTFELVSVKGTQGNDCIITLRNRVTGTLKQIELLDCSNVLEYCHLFNIDTVEYLNGFKTKLPGDDKLSSDNSVFEGIDWVYGQGLEDENSYIPNYQLVADNYYNTDYEFLYRVRTFLSSLKYYAYYNTLNSRYFTKSHHIKNQFNIYLHLKFKYYKPIDNNPILKDIDVKVLNYIKTIYK